jgi:hypothetical protein
MHINKNKPSVKIRYFICLFLSTAAHIFYLIAYFIKNQNLYSFTQKFFLQVMDFFAVPFTISILFLSYTIFHSVCYLLYFIKIDSVLIDVRLHSGLDGPPDPTPLSRFTTFAIIYPVSIVFFIYLTHYIVPEFSKYHSDTLTL